MELLDAGEWTGNVVALPNNRVQLQLGLLMEKTPDFRPLNIYIILNLI